MGTSTGIGSVGYQLLRELYYGLAIGFSWNAVWLDESETWVWRRFNRSTGRIETRPATAEEQTALQAWWSIK
ncbi:hypothetical protein [Rhodopseudomonas pseudopalustris]|uniref:hypothetical protein n=1 Tax=Rhodopseudomonas pseudopalustris TaxID=1513892 RepID=UPI0011135EA8|nr:hypothetical protein [Rhodopseudomonas pseudopalustris]